MLERVRFTDYAKEVDVEAFTDGYAYDGYSHAYLLSVAGRDSNVKAITSAFVSGRQVQVQTRYPVDLGRAFGQQYRVLSTKLPDALLHQVVAAEGLFKASEGRQRLLYLDGKDDVARTVFEAVRSGYPVPMLPEWSEWLYRELKRRNHLEELTGTRRVVRLNVDEGALDALISEGVKNGEITF